MNQYILTLDLGWEKSYWLVSGAHNEPHARSIFLNYMYQVHRKSYQIEQISNIELVEEIVQHITSDFRGD